MKNTYIFLLVLINCCFSYSQTQLGNDIDGEAVRDFFGWSTAISDDGTRIAVSSKDNGDQAGHVRIFELNGSNLVQLGLDIDGESVEDESGWSISMSADGSKVAVGAPQNDGNGTGSGHARVFEWNGSSWEQLGSDIEGESLFDSFGYSVALSDDGNRLAVGAIANDSDGNNNAGHVRIFELSNNDWIQLGQEVNGQITGDKLGASVSLSANGNLLAIGAESSNNNGLVRIYEFIGGDWIQKGLDITSEGSLDLFGTSLALSDDGIRLIVGALWNDGNGFNAGHARIFEWDSSNWVQLGDDIDGEAEDDEFGVSVSIDGFGNRIAVGGRYNDGNGSNSGHTRLYDWNGTNWIQSGNDIDGEAANDGSGHSVAISANGNRIVIGATGNADAGVLTGHARVFDINSTLSVTENNLVGLSIFPNPSLDVVHIDGLIDFTYTIYDINGKLLSHGKNQQSVINISLFKSGLYILKIESESNVYQQKIIKQ